MVIAHSSVAYLLSTGLDCVLEPVPCEPSVFFPVYADPGPMGCWQALLDFLGPKGFLIWGFPHKLRIAIVRVVIHQCGEWIEDHVGWSPSNWGGDPWLGRNHMFNWGHGAGSGLQRFPDWPTWDFIFGPPWPLVGLSKQTGDTRGYFSDISDLPRYYTGLKEQWFNLWCQTRISLSPRPKRSLVDHSLAMYSLIISAPTAYLSTFSKLVGI